METRFFHDDVMKIIFQGHDLIFIGKFDEAVKKYNHALTIAPRNRQAYLEIGKGLFMLGRYSSAMLVATKAESDDFDNDVSKADQIAINQLYKGSYQHFNVYQEFNRKGTINTFVDDDIEGIKNIYKKIEYFPNKENTQESFSAKL